MHLLFLLSNEETIIQSTGVVTHHAARENCLPNQTVESARAILFQKVATHIESDSKVIVNTCLRELKRLNVGSSYTPRPRQ